MPRPRSLALPLLVALPPLLVGGLGLLHPVLLTPETAERWRLAHLLLLPAFPLLAASVWFVLRGERSPLAWGARVLALAYAVLYGALDSIAGLGAPQQVLRTTERGDGRPPIEDLYEIGDQLGQFGVLALAASLAVTAAVLLVRRSVAPTRGRSPLVVLGGVVAVLACYQFLRYHVFPPRGVLAMLGIAVGLALLEAGRGASDPPAPAARPART